LRKSKFCKKQTKISVLYTNT